MHAVSEIVVTDVTKAYEPVVALDGVTFDAGADETVGLVGRSGCGKSTLLRMVAGLESPDRGAVSVGGAGDEKGRLERCALMPQSDLLMPWRDALGNASLPLENAGVGRREARARAAELFAELGLEGFEQARSVGALGRHAPTRGVRTHAARREAGPAPRRAVRRARRDHPHRDAGVAGRRHGRPAPDRPPRHARPRRGAPAVRPRRRPDPTAGPGGVRARAAAAAGEAAREQALGALR